MSLRQHITMISLELADSKTLINLNSRFQVVASKMDKTVTETQWFIYTIHVFSHRKNEDFIVTHYIWALHFRPNDMLLLSITGI